MKIKQEDGTEIDVFSQEEMDAKIKETEDKKTEELRQIQEESQKKEVETKTALETLQKEKADLEAKIAAGGKDGDQTGNFKTLKEALDKKSEEIAALHKDLGDIRSQSTKDQRTNLINKIAGKDTELKKKIELFYEKDLSGMSDKSPEEVMKKVEAAAKLAGEVVEFDPLSGAIMGGGGKGFAGGGGAGAEGVEFTAKEKQLGSKMGITEADYKKYGPKLKK